MNKKILAVLMALMMVLTSVAAFAEGDSTVDATFDKIYTNVGDTADAPAATFSFVVGKGTVQGASAGVVAPDASNINITDAVLTSGAGKAVVSVDVKLDAFTEVGSYSYPVTEVQGTLAGVSYDATFTVVVLVNYDADTDSIVKAVYVKNSAAQKDDEGVDVENKYYAGSLEFSKTVTGAYGDPNKYFTVTVTINGPEGKALDDINMVANGGKYTNKPVDFGANTFEIKHDETITISNLPKGATYTIAEADYSSEGYDAPVYSAQSGNIAEIEKDSITITNNKADDQSIETGVFTDNMPYFMLLAFVMILAAAVVLKKRTVNE